MINKALFKQSCKANWVKWLSVTLSTCIMLAIVIIVLGNLSINDIRDSLKNVFVQADQEAYIKENAIDTYDLYLTTVEQYNQNYMYSSMVPTMIIAPYNDAIEQYKSKHDGQEPTDAEKQLIIQQTVEKIANNVSSMGIDGELIKPFALAILMYYKDNPTIASNYVYDMYFLEQIYQQSYQKYYEDSLAEGMTEEEAAAAAESAAETAKGIAKAAIEQYKNDRTQDGASYVFTQEKYQSLAQVEAIRTISQNAYDSQIAQGADEETAQENALAVRVIANTSISTYQFWLNQYAQDEENDNITQQEIEQAREKACQSISDEIPEKVAVALQELGNMDMNGLIIGSIFYRIAGLLLPMVFVIMAANGLLAGQVDSGSMAYVLSTPTKRRAVSTTQLAYLIFSLFAMFALLTVVSVMAVWAVGGNEFAINFKQILLFNLGAFLTMFAIAGFCFMCSAIFNRTKHSLSIGGGLTIFSLVCTILGLFGSDVVPSAMRISAMNYFNYISIITLFDTVSIMENSINFLWKFGVLVVFGLVCITIGVLRFDKKDLPL